MAEPVCPICKKPAAPKGDGRFPFCSDRCKVVDLGRWLSGSYRVPVEEDPDRPGEGEAERLLH